MGKAKASRLKTRLVKIKGRAKAKTWAKGHSSDSNPSLTKYRDIAARNRHVINSNDSPTTTKAKKDTVVKFQLSTEKMQKRNQNLLAGLTLGDDDDDGDCDEEKNQNDDVISTADQSASAATLSLPETTETQFTQFTNCTNPTFNKVHRLWKSGSEMQNDVLSVLAAVTEVIKAANGRETELEYFAALVGTLKSTDQSSTSTLAAATYLLSLVIRKIPYSVLCKEFSQLSELFYSQLTAQRSQEDSEANALIRYTIECFGVTLKAQHVSTWESPSVKHMCESILVFAIDERPRIRKSAQTAIANLLERTTDSSAPRHYHPAGKICADFCADKIRKCGGTGKTVHITLYAVQLLQKCAHRFPTTIFKSTCECLLSLMTLCDAVVAQAVLRCLCYTFTMTSSSDDVVNAELNGQLIKALYDFEPPVNELKSRLEWYKTMLAAYLCLLNKDDRLCASFLPKIFENFLSFMPQIENRSILGEICILIKQLLIDCTQILLTTESLGDHECQKLAANVQHMLSSTYYNVWPQCFEILSTFFTIFSIKSSTNSVVLAYVEKLGVKSLLGAMGELRDSENFPYIKQLEKCISTAVCELGPEIVLTSVPIDIDSLTLSVSLDFRNSWLLPILHRNITKSKLSHFVNTFLPLAAKIEKAGLDPQRNLSDKQRAVFNATLHQLWDLLPAYCNRPTDLPETFEKLGKTMYQLLDAHPLLRSTILSALRTLILRCIADDDETGKAELAKYAKNFLPALFRLYVSDTTNPSDHVGYDEKGVRLATLETIRVYLRLASRDLTAECVRVAVEKLEHLTERKPYVMDILAALVKHLTCESLSLLYNGILKYFRADDVSVAAGRKKVTCHDRSMQKKAYRVLQEILSADESCEAKKFIEKERASIIRLLTSNLRDDVIPATKACRLRCLTRLVENHANAEMNSPMIIELLPDAVLCLKENNIKTRRSAAIFFVTACNTIITKEKDAQTGMKLIWDCLLPYFDGQTSRDVCCAIISARIFVFEFKNDCSSEILSLLLSKVIFLLADHRRPVVQSGLEFLKTFVSCLSQITIGQYLDTFMPALYKQTPDCQHHFRFLTRKILAKLVRKFSYEIIRKFVTAENFKKQLNSVRKALQRYENKKTMSKTADRNGYDVSRADEDVLSGVTGLSRPETIADLLRDTSDEDDDDAEEPKFDGKSRKSAKSSARTPIFLHENAEDDEDGDGILDFLDKKAPSMISTFAGLPKKSARRPADHGFSTDDQGRLIITASVDEHGTKMSAPAERVEFVELGSKRKVGDDKYENQESSTLKKRKKRDTVMKDDDGDSDLDEALSHKYKPGGTGIHRNINNSQSRDDPGGEKFGAKKYKARKGKGDVFVKDGLQPYAYVPFDFKQLNKRKRAKLAGKYKNLIEGARKGATKGSKGRRKAGK